MKRIGQILPKTSCVWRDIWTTLLLRRPDLIGTTDLGPHQENEQMKDSSPRTNSKPVRSSMIPQTAHALQNKEDVTHLLVLRFQQLMSEGVLKPGTRLPPERELAGNFGVARSSLRQALKVLEIMGVITQKVGDGSYLNPDASAVLSVPMEFLLLLDDISLQELTEMRLMVEPAMAALAAERATAADIAQLRQSIQDLETSKKDRIKLVTADLRFHRSIAEATGNRLGGRLFHLIHRAMLNMIMLTSGLVDLEHTLQFHKPILQAIERRDAERARTLMTDHLLDAQELVLQMRRQINDRQFREHISAAAGTVSRRRTAHETSARGSKREKAAHQA